MLGGHFNNLGKRGQKLVGSFKKWSVSGYISKLDVYGLDVEYERKRNINGNSNYFLT